MSVFGIGINDLLGVKHYESYSHYYTKWANMLQRCYSGNKYRENPSYADAYVCQDWLKLSNFISWVDSQSNSGWQCCHLDKDLLIPNNKIYSPDKCIFLTLKVNSFLSVAKRGNYLIGVDLHKATNLYRARCSNPITGHVSSLGYFASELEAHKAWQAKKHEYACKLADTQEDERVSKALRERYAPDKDWTKA